MKFEIKKKIHIITDAIRNNECRKILLEEALRR